MDWTPFVWVGLGVLLAIAVFAYVVMDLLIKGALACVMLLVEQPADSE